MSSAGANSAPPSLDHVQVTGPSGCEPEARAFYGELLGLRELDKPPVLADRGGAWFALTGGQLHIGIEEPFAPATKAHPALRFADERALRSAAQRLAGAGAEVVWAPEFAGVKRLFTFDPWGNRLELIG